jgi:O-antigen/teichoic acid export membrane protein
LRIARHTFYNLLGLGLPLLLALVSIPALLTLLGEERFGWLTLLWALVSYLGLLDLGLSRALTQQLALALSGDRWDEAGAILGTTMVLVAALGGLGGALLVLLASQVPAWLPHATEPDRIVVALRWMGLALPFTVLTAVLRGALEAAHAFAAINLVRLPLGLWTFAGPWMVAALWGSDLGAIALALALGRVAGLLAHGLLVGRALRQLRGRWRWQSERHGALLKAGGWLTLGNVISPLMGYADRFFIGVSLSGAAAAYYVAPQELVTKLWIIPGALTAVLLPAFAERVSSRPAESWRLFDRSVEILFLLLLPLTLCLAMFSRELLGLWLGREFAGHSAPLLSLFAAGILVNCLAHVPLTWLHGMGRFRAPALLQLAEFPLFMGLLWLLCARWGLVGAAVAWLARMTLDAMCLFFMCRLQRGGWPSRAWMAAGLMGLAPFLLSGWDPLGGRLLVWTLVLLMVLGAAWRRRGTLLERLDAPIRAEAA